MPSFRRRVRPARARAMAGKGNHKANRGDSFWSRSGGTKVALDPVVVTVRVEDPPDESEAGLNEQLAPAGSPEQARLTDELNPFWPLTETV